MSVNFESLSDVLKHSMRRRILLTLYERKNLSYVDLMDIVGVTSTGKLNYHLKILSDLIEKDQNGKYGLSEKGLMAAELLRKFPEKKTEQTSLYTADAALIGFAGAVLTVVNPVFWGSLLVILLKSELTVAFFSILGFVGFVYALMVPGAVMWLLTVRRAHSHDMYDLLKPSFGAFILLLILLIVMFVLKINLTVSVTSPATPNPSGGVSYLIMQTSLGIYLLAGLAFSFLGVITVEFISKMRKRVMP